MRLGIDAVEVRIRLDVRRGDGAGAILLQVQRLGGVHVEAERHRLQVENQIRGVLDNAGERAEFMEDAFHLERGNGSAFHGGKQHATERVSDRDGKAALEGLGDERTVLIGQRVEVNLESLRSLEPGPEHIRDLLSKKRELQQRMSGYYFE